MYTIYVYMVHIPSLDVHTRARVKEGYGVLVLYVVHNDI